mmetsp:Transcript_74/g.276  ORF Transcript_74/g.276 Transcript_74/m.276 type:complete len:230 (+) Transcript_74:223-912(+)
MREEACPQDHACSDGPSDLSLECLRGVAAAAVALEHALHVGTRAGLRGATSSCDGGGVAHQLGQERAGRRAEDVAAGADLDAVVHEHADLVVGPPGIAGGCESRPDFPHGALHGRVHGIPWPVGFRRQHVRAVRGVLLRVGDDERELALVRPQRVLADAEGVVACAFVEDVHVYVRELRNCQRDAVEEDTAGGVYILPRAGRPIWLEWVLRPPGGFVQISEALENGRAV